MEFQSGVEYQLERIENRLKEVQDRIAFLWGVGWMYLIILAIEQAAKWFK